METPLIHTSKGNLPLDSLVEKVVWTDNEEETICAIEHWLGEECVRRQVNIMKRKGNSVLGAIGQL
jgi:hypothetical protein